MADRVPGTPSRCHLGSTAFRKGEHLPGVVHRPSSPSRASQPAQDTVQGFPRPPPARWRCPATGPPRASSTGSLPAPESSRVAPGPSEGRHTLSATGSSVVASPQAPAGLANHLALAKEYIGLSEYANDLFRGVAWLRRVVASPDVHDPWTGPPMTSRPNQFSGGRSSAWLPSLRPARAPKGIRPTPWAEGERVKNEAPAIEDGRC